MADVYKLVGFKALLPFTPTPMLPVFRHLLNESSFDLFIPSVDSENKINSFLNIDSNFALPFLTNSILQEEHFIRRVGQTSPYSFAISKQILVYEERKTDFISALFDKADENLFLDYPFSGLWVSRLSGNTELEVQFASRCVSKLAKIDRHLAARWLSQTKLSEGARSRAQSFLDRPEGTFPGSPSEFLNLNSRKIRIGYSYELGSLFDNVKLTPILDFVLSIEPIKFDWNEKNLFDFEILISRSIDYVNGPYSLNSLKPTPDTKPYLMAINSIQPSSEIEKFFHLNGVDKLIYEDNLISVGESIQTALDDYCMNFTGSQPGTSAAGPSNSV